MGCGASARAKVADTKQPLSSQPHGKPILKGRYLLSLDKSDVLGEGSNSIVRLGFQAEDDAQSGKARFAEARVAVKTYKKKSKGGKSGGAPPVSDDVTLQKFRRQVRVLERLHEELVPPKDESLWCTRLNKTRASDLFLQILDYSKNDAGEPDIDEDGEMYIITEMGNHSLKDALELRGREERPWEMVQIQKIAAALMIVVAGLHAKGLVHMDLKPQNFMFFGDRVKLIDVGGCIDIGTDLAKMERLLISFSPCYCAPEWAGFLFDWFGDDKPEEFRVTPGLDMWSLGTVLCELAELSPILKRNFNTFHQEKPSEARWLFLEWLSHLDETPMPDSVLAVGNEFRDLILSVMQCTPTLRSTAAQSISSAFFRIVHQQPTQAAHEQPPDKDGDGKNVGRVSTMGSMLFNGALINTLTEADRGKMSIWKADRGRMMSVDDSMQKPLHMGTLWKMKSEGNKTDAQDWKKTDFWISSNGSLCYYSHKQQQRLVMFDHVMLLCVKIRDVEGTWRGYGFELMVPQDVVENATIAAADQDNARKIGSPPTPHANKAPPTPHGKGGVDEDCESVVFATETPEEREVWKAQIAKVHDIEMNLDSLNLDDDELVKDLVTFKLKARNRRQKLKGAGEEWDPVWKSTLFKLKQEGEIMNIEDWREREFWISKNGYLVYKSKKDPDGKPLVYYTDEDLDSATFTRKPDAESSRPWTFSVSLGTQADGTSFEPGEFAAGSEAERERWLEELRKLQGDSGPIRERKKSLEAAAKEAIPGAMPAEGEKL